MTKRLLLLPTLLATVLLAACNTSDNTPAPATATPATETAPATTPSADEPAAPASSAAPAAAGETTSSITPESQAAADAATAAAKSGPGPVAGTDYEEIKDGQPWQPLNGKIEVVEVFGYVCPACAAFNPLVSAWKAKLPADVRFTYVPAPFGPEWIPYAKAYYVAESLGLVERTHDALIKAIHVTNTMPGEGDKPDEMAIAKFYGQYGANPQEFLSTMNSFTVDAKVNQGRQFMVRSGVAGTPTLIVNGKYRVMGRTFEDMLRIASQLIERERAAKAGAPAAAQG
jgi:protein dithiol oxidoreductase (disulfide-forming)